MMITACYFQKPADPIEPGLDNQVASGPGGNHHADGVPAAEGQRPVQEILPSELELEQAPTVQVSGRIRYAGSAQGNLRVDALQATTAEGTLPQMMASTAAADDGIWVLEIPQDAGTIDLWGYVDADDNGPSVGEPKVLVQAAAQVEHAPVKGLQLQVLDDWDQRHPTSLDGYDFQQPIVSPDSEAVGPGPTANIDGEPAPEGQRALAADESAEPATEPGVTVSGTIHYQGAERGSLRVDALRRGALEDGQPRMIATTAAAGDGSWQLAIPEGSGTVDLWGYLDRDDNGPSLTEPKLLVDGGVTVDSAPVTGLVLRVEDGWDDQHPTTLDQLYLAPESTGPTPPPPGAQVKP